MRFSKSAIYLALILGLGCDGTPAPTDAGPGGTDAGPGGTDAGPTDSAVPPAGDGNDSFADADMIMVGADATMARIGTPGDRDYYTFEGTEGTWMILSTEANPDDDDTMIDTVITLYDSTMTMVAENDDSVPRVSTDSELIVRLPSTGTYYVLVQEFSQWNGDTPEGQMDFDYALSVAELNLDAPAVGDDTEAGDDLASAVALGYTAGTAADFGIVVGDFRDDSDVDVFSFTVPATRVSARFLMMPSGETGYGSTTAVGRMWITSEDGTQIIARLSVTESDTADITSIWPPLPAGSYRLFVENGGAPGANGFYVLKTWLFAEDNDPEDAAMDAANDLPAGAQPLVLEPVEGEPTTRRAFVLALLSPGDTDHFSFDVMGTEQVNAYCGSATAGSGVMGLNAAVLDSTGAMELRRANETATAAVAIEDLAVSAPGTYLLRIAATGQSPEVTGAWVRCAVLVAPPAAMP